MHTLHNNWIIGFAAWLVLVFRAVGLVAFYMAAAAAVLLVLAAIMLVVGLMMLWAGIHVMLFFWPMQ